MSTTTPPPVQEDVFFPHPEIELIETDGEPLESDWHRLAMNLLIESVYCHLAGRTDYYVGGNMFIYFSEEHARNRDFRGPDFFLVWNAPSTPMRPYWAVWKEGGRYPDIIIELSSPTTVHIDRTVKKELYRDVFRTRDYFCYDPDSQKLEGWRLDQGQYVELTPSPEGRLWCAELGLWLGTWVGEYLGQRTTWLRFFTAGGNVVEVFAEAERKRADAERKRADEERNRADAQDAELARLKAQLGGKNGPA